jgi:hypothetical protein
MKWIPRMLAIVAFALGALGEMQGCTCAFGSGPACQEAWRQTTDAVLLGRVEKIESAHGSVGSAPGAMSMTMMGFMLRVTISINEVYRGPSAKTIEVYTASSSAACGYSFREGQEYLIYASAAGKDAELVVSLCSATKPAEYAEKDLAYLRSLPSLAPTSAIMGTVWRYTHDPNFKPKFQPSLMDHYRPPEQEYMAMKPEPGFTVLAKAQDGTEHSAIANDDGNWRIPDLSPGRYTLLPQAREGVYVHPFFSIVEIAPKGCAQANIRVESNGRISGALDHPAPGSDWVLVKVFAPPVSESDWHRPTRETTLEPNASTFEIGPLPSGKYVLGAYVAVKINTDNGYTFGDLGPFYYPGVTGIKGAEPIDVAEGKAVTNLKFRIMY